MAVDPDIIEHYQSRYAEASRLDQGIGLIEQLRTREIISRTLPPEPQRILDIGGGPGAHARWLTQASHRVTLLDPVPRHVEAATELGLHAERGDARDLGRFRDGHADIVLLLGPLYHLPEPEDRVRALAEAGRVLRPGGRLFAAAISRFAAMHDRLVGRMAADATAEAIVRDGLATGVHRNPSRNPAAFTTAYFHRPEDLRAEVSEAGFEAVSVAGLEGLVGNLPDIDERLADPEERRVTLALLAETEAEPSLLGVSAHLLATGVAPTPSG